MGNVHHHRKFGDPTSNGSLVINFFLVIFFLVNYYLVTFGSDRQADRRKAMPRSPPCISTGGLKHTNPEKNFSMQRLVAPPCVVIYLANVHSDRT